MTSRCSLTGAPPLTEAMSPLKVYEYLAAGLPVVSIDLPPVRDIGDRVLLASSTAEMAPMASIGRSSWAAATEGERVAFRRTATAGLRGIE